MIVRALGWAVTVLAVLAAVGIATSRPLAYDLIAYTDASRRLLAGGPLYPIAARDEIFLGAGEYLYPPLTAVLFIPLALLPLDVARAGWTAGLVALAAVIGAILVRPLRPAIRPWALAAYALYLPLIAELTLGNLNLVSLALCLAAWHWRGRPIAGGAVLAAAVGLKLVPIALPLFFIGAGRGRLVAWTAVLGSAVTLLSLVRFAEEWRTYVGLALGIAAAPATQAVPLMPSGLPVRISMLVAGLAVLAFAGSAARDPSREREALALALAAMLLAAPAIWYPYLVFALPLLAALAGRVELWPRIGAAGTFAALEIPTRMGSPAIAFVGLAGLLAIGLAVIREPRAAPRT
jgi:alpha-1,2-mannosyltransferase